LTTWNKVFSVLYVTIADVRNVFQKINNINKVNNIINTLSAKWVSNINSGKKIIIKNYSESSLY